jgi:hypothetical protein
METQGFSSVSLPPQTYFRKSRVQASPHLVPSLYVLRSIQQTVVNKSDNYSYYKPTDLAVFFCSMPVYYHVLANKVRGLLHLPCNIQDKFWKRIAASAN